MPSILKRLKAQLEHLSYMGHQEELEELVRDAIREIEYLKDQNKQLRKYIGHMVKAVTMASERHDAIGEEK